jgi:tetratricopeptide (TPR) repeat protein
MLNARINFDRAQLLLQQHRYADAERELRQTLAADPHFAEAHAMLAEALLHQQRLDEASNEAALAIMQDPESEVGHFVMGRVLLARNRHDEAEQAVLRAIELTPYPRSFGLLAATRYERRDWRGTLAAADEGLAIDPEDSNCLNLRAMALRQLGRHDEADRMLSGALEADPDDSFAHSNRGWSELHQSRPREALVHFQEALRLDPSNDHARLGLVEAMKARYFLYRLVLGYFLWMNRLAAKAQFAIIIGGWIAYQVVHNFAKSNPQYAWLTLPVMVAYLAFAWMTWLAAPLMNLALRLHPVGRHALSDDQRRTANLVGAMLLAAILSAVIALASGVGPLLVMAMFFAFATMPASMIFIAEAGWPRLVLVAMTACVVALGAGLTLADMGVISPSARDGLAMLTLPLVIACIFGGQIVAAQRVKR